MKRKLVEYEVFQEMRKNSLTSHVNELVEAEEHLANALDLDGLELNSVKDSSVIYETSDGTFIRANYDMDDKNISFDNIEEIVIDEDTEKNERHRIVSEMMEAIVDEKAATADELFGDYMKFSSSQYKRYGAVCESTELNESKRVRFYTGERAKGKVQTSVQGEKKDESKRKGALKSWHGGKRKKSKKRAPNSKNLKLFHSKGKALSGGRQYKAACNEWLNLANNVFSYADFAENRHVLNEAVVSDDKTQVTVPNSKARNEGKILMMQFDLMKTDCKVLREHARRLFRDMKFAQAVAEIKTHNNLAENDELEESINQLVTKFPSVLYLSEEELAKAIGTALDSLRVTNYDDQTCKFIAEGILRVAHNVYPDRVDRIMKLANYRPEQNDDNYVEFQKVVSQLYPHLDESTNLEMKMFEDLYNGSVEVRKIAIDSQNQVVRNEASDFITDLEMVLSGDKTPTLELAMEVADWLETLAETNLESEKWEIVKSPHMTTVGNHPDMNKIANKSYTPSKDFSGDWGDVGPQISGDKVGYKGNAPEETRSRSWSNKGPADKVWPDLRNPYVPTPFGDYKMKGEKSIDKDSDNLATWQSKDTWAPGEGGLQNPYLLKSFGKYRQQVEPQNKVEPD